jgi:alkanesulfonate monooxygenase SsuD/methylene tetrahydromethanopterin reductase-like flavin-dependent oxidoreductase (luciferase family)
MERSSDARNWTISYIKNWTPFLTGTPEELSAPPRSSGQRMGGLPLVGDPDAVAWDMARLAALGLKGIAVSFVNYLDELPYFCAEVLPRRARSGLREIGAARRPGSL